MSVHKPSAQNCANKSPENGLYRGGLYYSDPDSLESSFEPVHEIMALFVLRKLFLQMRMRSDPVGLDVWFLVRPFLDSHTLCVRTAKALARLRGCAGSPEPSLVAYLISTIISLAGSFIDWLWSYTRSPGCRCLGGTERKHNVQLLYQKSDLLRRLLRLLELDNPKCLLSSTVRHHHCEHDHGNTGLPLVQTRQKDILEIDLRHKNPTAVTNHTPCEQDIHPAGYSRTTDGYVKIRAGG